MKASNRLHHTDIFWLLDALTPYITTHHQLSSKASLSLIRIDSITLKETSVIVHHTSIRNFDNVLLPPCSTRNNLHPLSTRLIRHMHRGLTPCLSHHIYLQADMKPQQSTPTVLGFTTTTIKCMRPSLRRHRLQILGRATSQAPLLLWHK